MKKDYGQIFEERYRASNSEVRALVKVYWIKAHRVTLAAGRHELSDFTAQILARITIVEADEKAA